ncbi:ASCH domain-containing protein [Viridibacillus arvi]|uniref:ASCH domain-containing protein n=1 Tax=Viridibacillus arvi TaxID=263475 RepID=UPI003D00437A
MGLYGDCFGAIKEGKKTVEVRLNDENRRGVNENEIFTCFHYCCYHHCNFRGS